MTTQRESTIETLQRWASEHEFYISGSTLLCQFFELVTSACGKFIFAQRNITLGGYLDTHKHLEHLRHDVRPETYILSIITIMSPDCPHTGWNTNLENLCY